MTQPFRAWTRAATVLAVAGLASLPACHRGYYRRMADSEARQMVIEKKTDPRVIAADGDLAIDAASRMFDPFSQDHPPIPPDDPESQKLMNCVDGRSGYPHWHANGDTAWVENPEWMSWLPRNDAGKVVVDSRSAVELAFVHSPDYQRQREELYLSALDVTLERFGFDSQLFAGFNSFFATRGNLSSGGSSSTLSGSLGSTGQGLRLQKLTATGANFTVGLANSLLWDFAGSSTQSASTLINFSLVQPLLRGGGRDRIMESLTQVERTLLANVRQFERYRQGFQLSVLTGRSPGPGPNRGGNFLSPPPASPTGAGGFYGLLQAQQQIAFAAFNVQQQQDFVDQIREFFDRERIDLLQVAQTENSLYDAQANLLQQQINYQNQLDRFKQTMGLPPWLDVEVKDPFLDQFRLISDRIQSQQVLVNELRKEIGSELNDVAALLPNDDVAEALEFDEKFQWPAELDQQLADLKPFLARGLVAAREILDQDREEIEADLKKLEEIRPRRLEYLAELRADVRNGRISAPVNLSLLDPANIPEAGPLRENQLASSLRSIEQVIVSLESLQQRIDELPGQREKNTNREYLGLLNDGILREIPRQLTNLNNALIELTLVQAQARSNSISLATIDLDAETATAIARCLRLDWMNARASLVDSWRQIEFTADQLESQLDFVFEGGVGNVGDNPFRIRFANGNLRGGFRFDTPLVRMAERNQYRQTLIRYQQARRSFYQFEDEASRNLRQVLRTIELNRVLFELNRVAIQVAIKQVESAKLKLEEPARFSANAVRTGLGATTARDLTGAFNQLQRAQTQFLDVWVDYEVLRRNLDYDLGTFMLDEQGHWIDPGEIDASLPYRFVAQMGLDPSCLECQMPPDVPFLEGAAPETDQDGATSSAIGSPTDAGNPPPDPDGTDSRNPPADRPEPGVPDLTELGK